MFLRDLSKGILEELNIAKVEQNELIQDYANHNNDSSFNIKRAFKNMRDNSFDKFLNGVLPIQEYKLTLEVVRDGKTYSTSISSRTSKQKDYIRLGNTTCLKVKTGDSIQLVDINTEEYREIIGAYDDKRGS